MPRTKTTRRKKMGPESVGLSPAETRSGISPELSGLAATVEKDGGTVLGYYRDPYGGREILLVALPIGTIRPTPYRRDPSENHVKRLMRVIEKIGRYLDPIIVVRQHAGYWTPNGNHRLQALTNLGAKTITGLLIPEPEIAFQILALNTEKAHNLRETPLETIRMARALAAESRRRESDYAFEFEEASFLTLGACYERRPLVSGGAYQPVLRRADDFLELRMEEAMAERERRAARVLELDDAVAEVVSRLKVKGLARPYRA